MWLECLLVILYEIVDLSSFCNNKYGHYAMKLLFNVGSMEHKQILITNLINSRSVLLLLQNIYGRHVFESIIKSNFGQTYQIYITLFIDALKQESLKNGRDGQQNIFTDLLFTPSM